MNKKYVAGFLALTALIAYTDVALFNAICKRSSDYAKRNKPSVVRKVAQPQTQSHSVASNLEKQATAPEPLYKGKSVVIDAGHGMGNTKKGVYDKGAFYFGIRESDVNLDIAKRVGSKLEASGVKVRYTRQDDESETPLSGRVGYANGDSTDIFVSLHANSSTNHGTSGPIAYFYPGSTKGSNLASRVIDGLNSSMADVPMYSTNSNPVRSDNFAVLRNSRVPAVLIETGFMTNSNDIKVLTQNQDQIAEGIAKGVRDYLSTP